MSREIRITRLPDGDGNDHLSGSRYVFAAGGFVQTMTGSELYALRNMVTHMAENATPKISMVMEFASEPECTEDAGPDESSAGTAPGYDFTFPSAGAGSGVALDECTTSPGDAAIKRGHARNEPHPSLAKIAKDLSEGMRKAKVETQKTQQALLTIKAAIDGLNLPDYDPNLKTSLAEGVALFADSRMKAREDELRRAGSVIGSVSNAGPAKPWVDVPESQRRAIIAEEDQRRRAERIAGLA